MSLPSQTTPMSQTSLGSELTSPSQPVDLTRDREDLSIFTVTSE